MDDEELEEIRRRKAAQLQSQIQDAQDQQKMQEEYNQQKQMVMRKILDNEARSRLEAIRLARPEFASQLELQLIQLAQSGQLSRIGPLPLNDKNFKMILARLTSKKQDFKIKHI